jgi:hypothetical protein
MGNRAFRSSYHPENNSMRPYNVSLALNLPTCLATARLTVMPGLSRSEPPAPVRTPNTGSCYQKE